MPYNPITEPLAPEPAWRPSGTASAPTYIRNDGPALPAHPPRAYASGFEDGAFALARKLSATLATGATSELVAILAAYSNGNAHPAAGWHAEPPRN